MFQTALRVGATPTTGAMKLTYELLCMDCSHYLGISPSERPKIDCAFLDPPDNIGLSYNTYRDDQVGDTYYDSIKKVLGSLYGWGYVHTVWLSFNSRHTLAYANIVQRVMGGYDLTPMVQTFTFGQHNHHDFCNGHRPLWRFTRKDAPFYSDQVRVQSWRQANGDKRADPRGRVPNDVFDFTRVTGNSKQRRRWHPTQLNEGLVERCLLSCTKAGDTVLDLYSGTGTTLRVCKRVGRSCISVEIDETYCKKIAKENGLKKTGKGCWQAEKTIKVTKTCS